MARAKSVWGIDIGQCALKALKLVDLEEVVQVDDFAIIEHSEILSQPDVDRDQLIRQSLEQFLTLHDIQGSAVALSVPGQSSFTRFFKPPPVETKELPNVVRFEAAQQIPFPIDEVIWRWQAFQEEDSPDVEVGIFAMKRVDIADMLSHLTDVGMHADLVQVAPLALYNFMTHDEQVDPEGATLLVDMGGDKTDLVVAHGSHIWTRTIQIGGNNFTEALAKAFKLSFAKAEKLKRSAATSKYARQVFQAMRPVFSDLVQELQRSVGYYISLHRDTRFVKLLGMGNGFKLPGLQRFLEQNLNIPVARLDHFKHIAPSGNVNVPGYQEGVLSFGAAYGLAIQALRETRVQTNLLPAEIARQRVWAKKTPWFVTAAALALLALACPAYRSFIDSRALPDETKSRTVLKEAKEIKTRLDGWRKEYDGYKQQGTQEAGQINQYLQLFAYRDAWPSIEGMMAEAIRAATNRPGGVNCQPKLEAYALAATEEARAAIREEIHQTARDQRRMIFIENMTSMWADNVSRSVGTGGAAPKEGQRGFVVTVIARTPLRDPGIYTALMRDLRNLSQTEEIRKKFPAISVVKCEVEKVMTPGSPPSGPAGPRDADPMFPEEDRADDTRLVVKWHVAIEGDGMTWNQESAEDDGE
ncbi:MAG: type IV pilus assembly protein PilM [Planctomycetota bacterium]|jgi:type IV pilus assembly protein PilM